MMKRTLLLVAIVAVAVSFAGYVAGAFSSTASRQDIQLDPCPTCIPLPHTPAVDAALERGEGFQAYILQGDTQG